jgi:hypothetical protein
VNHLGQAIDICYEQAAALALNNAKPCKAIELSGYSLAVRANSARYLNMCRCRDNAGGLANPRGQFRKSEHFGMDSIADGECTEFIDAHR